MIDMSSHSDERCLYEYEIQARRMIGEFASEFWRRVAQRYPARELQKYAMFTAHWGRVLQGINSGAYTGDVARKELEGDGKWSSRLFAYLLLIDN